MSLQENWSFEPLTIKSIQGSSWACDRDKKYMYNQPTSQPGQERKKSY